MSSLNTTVLAGGVIYPAGTASSHELRKQIGARFWDDAPTDGDGYASMLKADLEAEIDKRNADRDPGGEGYLSKSGTKADLVAALEADDKA